MIFLSDKEYARILGYDYRVYNLNILNYLIYIPNLTICFDLRYPEVTRNPLKWVKMNSF